MGLFSKSKEVSDKEMKAYLKNRKYWDDYAEKNKSKRKMILKIKKAAIAKYGDVNVLDAKVTEDYKNKPEGAISESELVERAAYGSKLKYAKGGKWSIYGKDYERTNKKDNGEIIKLMNKYGLKEDHSEPDEQRILFFKEAVEKGYYTKKTTIPTRKGGGYANWKSLMGID